MEEELENFLKERRARVAEDRALLQHDPPYMELKTQKPYVTVKENIPPTAPTEDGSVVGLPLGLEYEKKKQKLQQELRMDYRHYITQKTQSEMMELLSVRNNRCHQVRPSSRRDVATITEERAPCTGHNLNITETEATDSHLREQRDVSFGRRSKVLLSSSEHFATGLIIGASDTDEMKQKKKERYRKELQQQMEEQLQNKRRERELEMKVAATGANDPEKPPDRFRQFGVLHRKREAAVETEPALPPPPPPLLLQVNNKPMTNAAPELHHVAFHSPLLDFSHALGLGPGPGLYHRSMDPPRIPVFPREAPSAVSDVYTNPPFVHRSPMQPHTPYYLSVPGAPYWHLPPGGAHSPSESSLQEHLPHPTAEESSPDCRVAFARERNLSYRDALMQQIQEHQQRRRVEREEKERYEAQLEEDMKKHQPWGRGGGGAPLRDSAGTLIADLKQMHKLNTEASIRPELRRAPRSEPDPHERVNGTVSVCSDPDVNDLRHGFTHVLTPQFARGSVFSSELTQQQLQEQDKYKAFLRLQIDEKLRFKAEERERLRVEEEREERRLTEQRARIQQEYEEEQERRRRKEMEQKAKNEELIQMAEERKKEAERRRKEEEEREREAQKRQMERERQQPQQAMHREPSPPIPTLQKKLGPAPYSPRPPTVESQQSIPALSERSLSGLQSPPVPARRNQLRAAGERSDVFSELAALRRQLRTEQRLLEERLHRDWDVPSLLSDRHRDRPLVDVFDMARLGIQAPVRRPSSRSNQPENLQKIHQSLQLKYNNTKPESGSRSGSGLVFENGGGSWRLGDDPSQSNSCRSTAQDDYSDFSPHHNLLLSGADAGSSSSLLQSDSAFIESLVDVFPSTPETVRPSLSARERRRNKQIQDAAVSSSCRMVLPLQDDSRNHRLRSAPSHHGDAGCHGSDSGGVEASAEHSPQFDPNSLQRNMRRLQPIRREHLVT